MYFSTFHSYFDETDTIKKEDKVCIICWESEGNIEELQMFVKNMHKCSYNANFHNKCLHQWFNKNNYCPMCRDKVNILEIQNDNNTNNIEKTIILLWLILNYCKNVFYIIFLYSLIRSAYNIVLIVYN
jgi:hypothetical protein